MELAQPKLETPRLSIRAFTLNDVEALFKMDQNPKVHKFLGNKPLKNITEAERVVNSILYQYKVHGIGRWAMQDKATLKFVGWCGFKKNIIPVANRNNFLDLGYRLDENFWGYGYATEASKTCLEYIFNKTSITKVAAMAMTNHTVSNKILGEKLGMKMIDTFYYDNHLCYFYELKKDEFL